MMRTPIDTDGSERTDEAMINQPRSRDLSRRTFLKYAGGAILVAAASAGAGPRALRSIAGPAAANAAGPLILELGGTDGWIWLPPTPAIPPFHPDPLGIEAVDGDPSSKLTTYIFGFRNVTGLSETEKFNQKNKAQHSAPLIWVNEYNGDPTDTLFIKLTNLGLQLRPDLFDAHTLHWHGFKNAIPYYDGEPSGSVAVPAGRTFEYAYRPRDPGTYMYHCHVEDVEHVQMGMTGMVFVRPRQNGTATTYRGRTFTQFAYNDGDGSTGYDREYAMFMSEVWAEAHWADAHIQLPEWSDYRADFAMLNGRVYPDTLEPSTVVNPYPTGTYTPYGPGGDLPIPARPELRYQPLSSLVTCNAGERVLLRFANLGFTQQTMTLTGLRATVVGKDATLLRGRTGANATYTTDSLTLGAGESIDAVFDAPPHSTGVAGDPPDVYMLFNREYRRSNNLAPGGFGGQATEIRVYPTNTLRAQAYPHEAV
jgi:FtsP/CotA-like multicopper oxidase with cupredoxin domain